MDNNRLECPSADCSRCGKQALSCLRDAWTVSIDQRDNPILHFTCSQFELVVALPARRGDWTVTVLPTHGPSIDFESREIAHRMDAINAASTKLACRGFFHPLSADAIAASIIVAIASHARGAAVGPRLLPTMDPAIRTQITDYDTRI